MADSVDDLIHQADGGESVDSLIQAADQESADDLIRQAESEAGPKLSPTARPGDLQLSFSPAHPSMGLPTRLQPGAPRTDTAPPSRLDPMRRMMQTPGPQPMPVANPVPTEAASPGLKNAAARTLGAATAVGTIPMQMAQSAVSIPEAVQSGRYGDAAKEGGMLAAVTLGGWPGRAAVGAIGAGSSALDLYRGGQTPQQQGQSVGNMALGGLMAVHGGIGAQEWATRPAAGAAPAPFAPAETAPLGEIDPYSITYEMDKGAPKSGGNMSYSRLSQPAGGLPDPVPEPQPPPGFSAERLAADRARVAEIKMEAARLREQPPPEAPPATFTPERLAADQARVAEIKTEAQRQLAGAPPIDMQAIARHVSRSGPPAASPPAVPVPTPAAPPPAELAPADLGRTAPLGIFEPPPVASEFPSIDEIARGMGSRGAGMPTYARSPSEPYIEPRYNSPLDPPAPPPAAPEPPAPPARAATPYDDLGYSGPTEPIEPIRTDYTDKAGTSDKSWRGYNPKTMGEELSKALEKKQSAEELAGMYQGPEVPSGEKPAWARDDYWKRGPARAPEAPAPKLAGAPETVAPPVVKPPDAKRIDPPPPRPIETVPGRSEPPGGQFKILKPVTIETPLTEAPLQGTGDRLRADYGQGGFRANPHNKSGLVDATQEVHTKFDSTLNAYARRAFGMDFRAASDLADRIAENPDTRGVMREMRAAQAGGREPNLTPQQRAAYQKMKPDIDRIFGGMDRFYHEASAAGFSERDLGPGYWTEQHQSPAAKIKVGAAAGAAAPADAPQRVGELTQGSLDKRRAFGGGDVHDARAGLNYMRQVAQDQAIEPLVKMASELEQRYLAKGDKASALATANYVRNNLLQKPLLADVLADNTAMQKILNTPIKVGFEAANAKGMYAPGKLAGKAVVTDVIPGQDGAPDAYRVSINGRPQPGVLLRDDVLAMAHEDTVFRGDLMNRLVDMGLGYTARMGLTFNIPSMLKAGADNPGRTASLLFDRADGVVHGALRTADYFAGRTSPERMAVYEQQGLHTSDRVPAGAASKVKSVADKLSFGGHEILDKPFKILHWEAARFELAKAHADWSPEKLDSAATILASQTSDIQTAATRGPMSRSSLIGKTSNLFQGANTRQASYIAQLVREVTAPGVSAGARGKSMLKLATMQGVTVATYAALFTALGGDPKLALLAAIPMPLTSLITGVGLAGSAWDAVKPWGKMIGKLMRGEDLKDGEVLSAVRKATVPHGVGAIYDNVTSGKPLIKQAKE